MTRFKEMRRIENAIKNKNKDELVWGKNYCRMRIKTANIIGLSKKMAAHHIKHWQKVLNEVEDVLANIA
jgi:hypothetical protein